MNPSRPALTRLSRRAGVKSMSDECYVVLRKILKEKLREILRVSAIVNNQTGKKMLLYSDVEKALEILGERITVSDHLGVIVVGGGRRRKTK